MADPIGSRPGVERRRAGWTGEEAETPPVPVDEANPVESLRKGLAGFSRARMFVAGFEMDMRTLVTAAIAELPLGMEASERALMELPCGKSARLYGMLTALRGGEDGEDGPSPVCFRLVPPFHLPDSFLLLFEPASRRNDDGPVKAYWVPLAAVSHGSITVVDPETVRIDHPFVVYRISNGALSVSIPPGARAAG